MVSFEHDYNQFSQIREIFIEEEKNSLN